LLYILLLQYIAIYLLLQYIAIYFVTAVYCYIFSWCFENCPYFEIFISQHL